MQVVFLTAVAIHWHLYTCMQFIPLFPTFGSMQFFFLFVLYIFSVYYRPSTIPGPVPDELVVPAAESIGLCQLIFNSVLAATVYYAATVYHAS